MITESSAVMPLLITRRLSSVTGPRSTGFGTTVPSGATTNRSFTDWSVTTAASGTSMVGRSCDIGTRTRPNWPGVMNRSGLENAARTRIVPEERSYWLSTKSMVPFSVHSFSSISWPCTWTELLRADLISPFCTRRL